MSNSISWISDITTSFKLYILVKQGGAEHSDGWWNIVDASPHPSASGPTYLIEKRTYNYIGNATGGTSPYSWRWEKRDQGSSLWNFWSSTQSTSYVPYAGPSYYFDFRLKATDSRNSFNYSPNLRVTVCIGCPPSPLRVPLSLSALDPPAALAAMHFGAGPWVGGINTASGDTVGAMYFDFHGNGDAIQQYTPSNKVKNYLETSFVTVDDRSDFRGSSTGVQVSQTLIAAEADQLVLKYAFRPLVGGVDDAIVGLAFDPDLPPDAGNDILINDSAGVVISNANVKDGFGYLGYVFSSTNGRPGIVRTFTPQFDSPSPADDGAVLHLLASDEHDVVDPGDVRFAWLLPTGNIGVGSIVEVQVKICWAAFLKDLRVCMGDAL